MRVSFSFLFPLFAPISLWWPGRASVSRRFSLRSLTLSLLRVRHSVCSDTLLSRLCGAVQRRRSEEPCEWERNARLERRDVRVRENYDGGSFRCCWRTIREKCMRACVRVLWKRSGMEIVGQNVILNAHSLEIREGRSFRCSECNLLLFHERGVTRWDSRRRVIWSRDSRIFRASQFTVYVLPNLVLAASEQLARTLHISCCLFLSLTTRRECTLQSFSLSWLTLYCCTLKNLVR